MATLLSRAVTHGEIDNTQRGKVLGRVWLLGREEPLELELQGNPWRDVAGARVRFVNPNARVQKAAGTLASAQQGIVGDITASKRVKHVTASAEEWRVLVREGKPLPFEWRNELYLEWFSEANGRVVIESAEYEVEITEFAWQMDEAEEQAQQLMNQHAMRDWLATIIKRPEQPKEESDEDAFTEAAWEESMKQSDRLNDAHMEAMDKYGDDDEDESRVAFVMGWDHLLDALEQDATEGGRERRRGTVFLAEEEGDEDDFDEPEDAGEEWKDDSADEDDVEGEVEGEDDEEAEERDFDAWMERRERHAHPLVKRGRDLVNRILDDLEDDERNEIPADKDPDDIDTPLDRFLENTLSISGKLAGALGDPDFAEGIEAGHTLAILKRCLNWSNEALAGLNDLLADIGWEDMHMTFSEYKRELHGIRDEITDLRRQIREANPGV